MSPGFRAPQGGGGTTAFPVAAVAIPAAISAAQTAFGHLSGKSQARQRSKAANQYTRGRETAVQELMGKLAESGYDIFGPQVSTGTSTGTTSESFDESTAPEITAEYQPMAQLQRDIIQRRLAAGTGLPAGWEETRIAQANEAAAAGDTALENRARQLGVPKETLALGSPVDRARRQDINRIRAEAPLLGQRLETENLGLASNVMQAFGRAERRRGQRRGTTTGMTTQTAPPDINALLNLLAPPPPQMG